MDPITQQVVLATAGAAAGEATYVDDVFSTFLYKGNNSTNVINNGIDLSGEGGLVWIKGRQLFQHILVDTERGATKYLHSNGTNAQQTAPNTVPSFSSTGFTTGTDNQVNYSASGQDEFVSWTFRKAPGFFDIVTYTGNGTAGRTIAHNLGSVPGFIIVKNTSSTANWRCQHRSLGAGKHISLDRDSSASTNTQTWNNTAPTSTVFSVGSGTDTNANGDTYVAYLFAHDDQSFGTDSDEAIVKCGSYTGGGSSETTVDLGFEPQWVIIKRTSASADWALYDNMRGVSTKTSSGDMEFRPNQSAAETDENRIDFYAQGFKLQNDAAPTNGSGSTYIYMAIRRPHKPPTAGTDVFALDATSASGTTGNAFDAPFPVDMALMQRWGSGEQKYIGTRLVAKKTMYTNTNSTEFNSSWAIYDTMDGVWQGFGDDDYSAQMFKRAPGFFDVVAYSGSSSVQNIPHNLQAEPELMIIKNRSRSLSWEVYNKFSGNTKYLQLNTTNGHIAGPAPHWNQTTPTSTHFTVGTNAGGVNRNGDTHIAYLFASLAGISKVGSYSGTGNNINVDCGFTAGARFVLIKQTEPAGTGSTGDWYVWDTAHGIVSGNDPYILLNDANEQVTNTDYIDPLNAGFTVTSSAPAALNTSGGTYLFLAIA